MKAYTKIAKEGKKMKKIIFASAIVISLLTPMSQVKADWKRDNVGWWYSLKQWFLFKQESLILDGSGIDLMTEVICSIY